MLLPWAHRTRLQRLLLSLLTTNVSNKSGNLLFAQSYPNALRTLDSCTVGAQSRPLLLRLRFSRLFTRISPSERQVHSFLASISRDRLTTLLRATVRSQLLERCAPSRAG